MNEGLIEKRKYRVIAFLLLLFTFLMIPFPVHADMGPKPFVKVEIEGLDEDVYYITLLARESSTGLYDTVKFDSKRESDKEGYRDFGVYEDKDGFHFLGEYAKCSGRDSFIWDAYAPEEFKFLIYIPRTDSYIISDTSYPAYAFHTRYRIKIEENQITKVSRHYYVTAELAGFLLRLIATVMIELLIGLGLGYFYRRAVRVIVITNVITQVILNIILLCFVGSMGEWVYFMYYPMLEVGIFIVEAIVYSLLLDYKDDKPHTRGKAIRKAWIYSFGANFVSFIAGWFIAMFWSFSAIR